MGPFRGILLARIWEMRSREEPFLATNHSQSLNVFQYNIDSRFADTHKILVADQGLAAKFDPTSSHTLNNVNEGFTGAVPGDRASLGGSLRGLGPAH